MEADKLATIVASNRIAIEIAKASALAREWPMIDPALRPAAEQMGKEILALIQATGIEMTDGSRKPLERRIKAVVATVFPEAEKLKK